MRSFFVGVLGNLTALESLDLSHNELQDLSAEPNIFNLPVNLTVLKLNDNHLQRFPVEPLVKIQNLTDLNLSNNLLESIDVKLIDKVKNGMRLYFEGKDALKNYCRIILDFIIILINNKYR